MNIIQNIALGLCTALFTVVAAQAETLLTVSGLGEPITYDRAALKALGEESFETTTVWTEGTQTFTGVPLAALVASLNVESGTLTAIAINDYSVDIPVSDAKMVGPMIAYEMNGAPMSVRDKGPLWIVYPYDSGKEFQTEVIYSRSIWQLDRISVKE